MKRIALACCTCVLGSAVTLVGISNSVPAGAINEYVGKTYEQAAESISQWGTPVVASRVGSFLPTGKCIVTGSHPPSSLDSSGNKPGGRMLLHINCNATTAASGHPGNSVATSAGRKAKELRDKGVLFSENFAKGTVDGLTPSCERYFDYCVEVCDQAGTCSDELLQYLGL